MENIKLKAFVQKYQISFYFIVNYLLGWIPIYIITGSPAYSAPIPLLVAFVLKWLLSGKLGIIELAKL